MYLKNYGLKLHRHGAPSGQFEYVLKTKGITLDWDTCQRVTYAEMLRRVLEYDTLNDNDIDDDNSTHIPIVLNYNFIRPNTRTGQIHTINSNKKYKALITKGIVLADYTVVPFGYVKPTL
jgi:hypothetical protein